MFWTAVWFTNYILSLAWPQHVILPVFPLRSSGMKWIKKVKGTNLRELSLKELYGYSLSLSELYNKTHARKEEMETLGNLLAFSRFCPNLLMCEVVPLHGHAEVYLASSALCVAETWQHSSWRTALIVSFLLSRRGEWPQGAVPQQMVSDHSSCKAVLFFSLSMRSSSCISYPIDNLIVTEVIKHTPFFSTGLKKQSGLASPCKYLT